MLKQQSFAWVLSAVTMILCTGKAFGQNYPHRPIRIVTGPIAGSADFVSRFIAQGVSGGLGQPVIVENRSGVMAEVVSKAPPDGYTVLVTGSNFWIGPLLRETPYDPVRDFLPVSLTNRAPIVLVVHPSVPVKTVKELIALAKARPGALNASTGGTGGSAHLALELFKMTAGVDIVRIPYKSGSVETADLLAGYVQMTFVAATEVAAHIRSGKLRGVAVASLQPSALVPDLPTVSASGVPGFEYGSITGMFAPAGTPATIVNRLNQEVVRFLNTPEAKEQLFGRGVEPVGSSPGELAATVKSEMARMGKVIRNAGIKAD